MALADGSSELADFSVYLPDYGLTLTSVESGSLTRSMLVPCDAWTMTVLADDQDTKDKLIPGTKVQIKVFGRVQCTGYIDKRSEKASRGGTVVTISGRDILGQVVDSNIDPKTKFTETMTLADVLAAVLAPFGITTIVNDGTLNVNVQTGAIQAPSTTSASVNVQVPRVKLNDDGSTDTTYETHTATTKTAPSKPALTGKQIKKMKPHEGEGCYQFLERMLKRFGLRMWALADGSGVIVDAPDFTTAPTHTLTHSRSNPDANNVEDTDATWDMGAQPACIVARGVGGADAEGDRTTLRVVVINELVGTDSSGAPAAAINDVLSRYKGAKVLDQRSELKPFRKHFAATLPVRPMFLKDDESKTLEQLQNFGRHEMATRQYKALQFRATFEGLGQGDKPFAMNTNIAVNDEVLDIAETLYVVECELSKARSGGTKAKVSCCLPFTLDIGDKNSTKDAKGTGSFQE